MSSVERQQIEYSRALGEDRERGICETDGQISVLFGDLSCAGDVSPREVRELVCTLRHLVEKRKFRIHAGQALDQVVKLREYERRQQ